MRFEVLGCIVPERDIKIPTGKVLAPMNRGYMLRQMMSRYAELYGMRDHITSLNHIIKETAPDDWDKSVLSYFERGVRDVQKCSQIDDRRHLQLMRPMTTKEGCLK